MPERDFVRPDPSGHSDVSRSGFASFSMTRKALVVTIGAGDIVEDVDYSTSAN